jgi:hypothetical protein
MIKYNNEFVNIIETVNGNLSITLTAEGILELQTACQSEYGDFAFYSLMESIEANSSFKYFADADTLGQMSNAPVFVENHVIEDDGTYTFSDLWYYKDYMVFNFSNTLIAGGEIIFTKA